MREISVIDCTPALTPDALKDADKRHLIGVLCECGYILWVPMTGRGQNSHWGFVHCPKCGKWFTLFL